MATKPPTSEVFNWEMCSFKLWILKCVMVVILSLLLSISPVVAKNNAHEMSWNKLLWGLFGSGAPKKSNALFTKQKAHVSHYIWRCPKIGKALVMIHFEWGFSLNKPSSYWGTPILWTPQLVWSPSTKSISMVKTPSFSGNLRVLIPVQVFHRFPLKSRIRRLRRTATSGQIQRHGAEHLSWPLRWADVVMGTCNMAESPRVLESCPWIMDQNGG